jgi:hypothetical protein
VAGVGGNLGVVGGVAGVVVEGVGLGEESAYRDYRDRYRAMATELGFEGT